MIKTATKLGFVGAALFSLTMGCGSGGGVDLDPPLDYNDPASCNPLGSVNCMMPWPSSAFLDEDPTTVTGYRVNIPAGALPVNIDGIPVQPGLLNRFDGFGPASYLLAGFEPGVSDVGLPGLRDIAGSLADDAPIALINMETGARVPYFAEVDYTTYKPEERSLIIRPMERMQPGTRHAVAITRKVKGTDGVELEAPAGFKALVDGTSFNHPLWDKVAPSYDTIFTAFADHGYAKEDMLLAWDFVTASDEFLTSDLLTMRAQANDWLEVNSQSFSVEKIERDQDRILRFYLGTFTAPNFLTAGEDDASVLIRDEARLPVQDGTYNANFGAIIPNCVEDVALPLPVMIFGHGLYGTGGEYLENNLLQTIAEQNCAVVIATDYIGLTERQIALTALTANEFSQGPWIVEKLGQAVVNFQALEYLIIDELRNSDEFKLDGQEIIDPNNLQYFGASLGGIMGGVLMAYSQNIRRGALGVPGGPWSLLFERSYAWGPIQIAAFGAYENQYVYQTMVSVWGTLFEPFDPITTAARVIHDPLPDTPAKQVFLYEAVNDALVHTVASEFLSREFDVPVLAPSVHMPWNMRAQEGALSSALAIYDEKVDPVPDTNEGPPRETGTHADIHERPAVLRQLRSFLFEAGEVKNECLIEGAAVICDCTSGACD